MIVVALSVAILAAAPAAEPTTVAPAVATAPAKTKAKPDAGDTVCKREPVLGSRMKQRLCMTQADWEARRIAARDELEKAQTNQSIK